MTKMKLLIAGAAAITAGAVIAPAAQAGSFGPSSGLGSVADSLGAPETVQYMWHGRRHCFYPDGWHGPGWYWCGYAHRRGAGWGGPRGWHGWREGRVEERSYTTGRSYREAPNTLRHTNRNSINKSIQRGSTTDEGAAPGRQ